MNPPAHIKSWRPGSLSGQMVRFVGVGLLCALVDVVLMQFLVFTGVSALQAASAGFAAGLVLNFMAHARVTFAVSMNWKRWWRFLVVVCLHYAITLLGVGLSVHWLADPLPGKLLSLLVVAVNGFFMARHWIFR